MSRKKWTAKEDSSGTLTLFREKRKWQLALRRYVLEKQVSEFYAPYFGIDIEGFRNWIAIQFTGNLQWDNFGSAWQFEHIIPVAYFDFDNEQDLRLCWNFSNIKVEAIDKEELVQGKINLLAARRYFQELFDQSGYSICHSMLEKISRVEEAVNIRLSLLQGFLRENKARLEQMNELDSEDYLRLNKGDSLESILMEKEILRKFGT
ncbi:MAG: hypothetical protein V9E88_10460 [Ferruginibacter sp.]